jgi:hypothetical protein
MEMFIGVKHPSLFRQGINYFSKMKREEKWFDRFMPIAQWLNT